MLNFLMMFIALVGSWLNLKRMWQGFLFWLISNGYWAVYNYLVGEYCQAGIFLTFFGLSIYGIFEWTRGKNERG